MTKKCLPPIQNVLFFIFYIHFFTLNNCNACYNSPIDFKLSEIISLAAGYYLKSEATVLGMMIPDTVQYDVESIATR